VKRRGRPSRPFGEIVDAALELAEEVGVDAFSMRALAERLNTSTATLYRHVASKDDLMVHVVDRVIGEINLEAADGESASWQAYARRRLLGLYGALSARPKLLPLLAAEVPTGPNGLAVREAVISDLVGFGFAIDLAARAYTTLARYAIGFVIQQHAPGNSPSQEATQLRRYYRALDPERFPATRAAADALTGVPARDEFLEGLQFILDGIDRARP